MLKDDIHGGGTEKKIRRVVNVAFVNRSTFQIALHKRIKERYGENIFWAFFGGRKDKDKEETDIEIALREIEEELGFILSPEDLIEVCYREVEKNEEIIQRKVYLVLTDKKESEFIGKEKDGEDGKLFGFDEAINLPFKNDISYEIHEVREKALFILSKN